MRIPDWIILIGIYGGLLVALISMAWSIATLLADILKLKRKKLFTDDLKLAILNSKLSWKQVIDLAETRNIKRAEVYPTLQLLIREMLTGRIAELQPHRAILEKFLEEFREAEPYEGIPEEIRIHLERLKDQVPDSTFLLHPLATQIRELLSVNDREQRLLKYYTVGGFFIGLLGLFFAAYVYLYPPQEASTVTTAPAPQSMSSPK